MMISKILCRKLKKGGEAFFIEIRNMTNKAIATGRGSSKKAEKIKQNSMLMQFGITLGAFVTIVLLSVLIIGDMAKKLESFRQGLSSFFSYLSRESTKAELIDINTQDEFGQMASMVISIKLIKEV